MNQKQNALEAVKLSTLIYQQSQLELEGDRQKLSRDIRRAREAGATQQQIADATVIDDRDFKLSRQRVAQIIQETSDE